jgi:peptidoglycan/xylan/chitin deacetylase (PgdA/CDA1 family)
MPQVWKDALQKALDAGKIPDVPRTTQTGRSAPIYPNGMKATDPKVCSGAYKCRQPEDIWEAPEGVFGVAFDDGPQPSTGKLIHFLENNDLPKVTQFMIGQNILRNPEMFKKSFAFGNDIAVHGYTHRYLTTLSNEDVVAELGWTMQLIANSTNGRIPRYMRAPYGDADLRIRAIAREIFGLTQVFWTHDSEDWSITNKQGKAKSQKKLVAAAKGPKSPGLIVLEHEISSNSIQVFIDSYQSIKDAGWKLQSVTSLKGSPYRNVDFGEVRPDNIVISHADPEETKPEEPVKEETEVEEESEEPAEGAEETEEPATEGEEETEEPAEGEEEDESTTTVEESSTSTSEPTSTSTSAAPEETSTEEETIEEEEPTEETTEEGKTEEQKKEEKKDNAAMQVKAAGPLFTVLCVVAVLLI